MIDEYKPVITFFRYQTLNVRKCTLRPLVHALEFTDAYTRGRSVHPYPIQGACTPEGVVLHSNLRTHALEFTDVTLEFTDAFCGPYLACTRETACRSCMHSNLRTHTREFTETARAFTDTRSDPLCTI